MKHKINIIIAIATLLFVTSCVKDTVTVDEDILLKLDKPVSIAGPVIKGKFLASEMITRLDKKLQGYVVINDDGLVTIHYSDSLLAEWNDVVKVADINFNKNIKLTGTKKSTIKEIEEDLVFNQKPTQRFDKMDVDSGTLNLKLDFPNIKGTVDITFPNLTKDNKPLKRTYALPSTKNVNENIELNGYHIKFKHNASKDKSMLTMQMKVTIIDNGTVTKPLINTSVNVNNIVPKVLFGYFGNEDIINKESSFVFNFFEDFEAVNIIDFKEMSVTAQFDNYFGVPFNGHIENPVIINRKTNDKLNIIYQETGNAKNTVFVEPATYTDNVEPKHGMVIADNTNSNITDGLNFFPDKLTYKMICNINPNNDPNTTNFITSDNKILGNMLIDIPLWLKTDEYKRQDTIKDVSFFKDFEEKQIKYIDYVTLGFDFFNSFPIDIDAEIYAANAEGDIIEPVFEGSKKFVISGKTNAEGKVTEVGKSEFIVTLNQDQVRRFKEQKAEQFIIKTKSITEDNGVKFVKIYENTGIELFLYISVKSKEQN